VLTGLRRERSADCLTDLAFDEWAAGELPPDEAERLSAHLSGCAVCAGRKRELALLAEGFLRTAPELPGVDARGPSGGRASRKGAGARRWLTGAGAVVAAAAAVALYAAGTFEGQRGTRLKGGPHVGFFVKRGGVVTEGTEGQRVRAGDRLRFVVTTDEPRHLAILSLDSRGAVSVFAQSPEGSVAVGAEHAAPLDESVELDDSPGRERVFALFCDAPFRVESIAARLKGSGSLEPPAGCTVQEFDLVKELP
jgi:hypothetical protein